MIVKNKPNCTITILERSELGLNSSPFLKNTISVESKTKSEIRSLMINHGMSLEEATKTHKENMEWAM